MLELWLSLEGLVSLLPAAGKFALLSMVSRDVLLDQPEEFLARQM